MATQNTRAEFRKKLLHLMIPISLQQLMMALVNASDAFMLGFVNQDALSAVSLAGQVQFVYSLFLFAIICRRFDLCRSVLGHSEQKGSGKDAGHRSGIFRAALPSLYHRRNIFPGTADACIRL